MNDNQQNTKKRLITVAAKIFAEKGYHQATTREICLAAEINITAIHYYFKDKKGLYRAIFLEHFNHFPLPIFEHEKYTSKNTHEFMTYYYSVLLLPFVEGKAKPRHKDGLFKYIHEIMAREQFEPTGLIDDLAVIPVKQIHDPLNKFLCKLFNIDEMDIEAHRLTFVLVGIGFSMVHPKHAINYYAPELIKEKGWQQRMYERLADFACAIINSEAENRKKKG